MCAFEHKIAYNSACIRDLYRASRGSKMVEWCLIQSCCAVCTSVHVDETQVTRHRIWPCIYSFHAFVKDFCSTVWVKKNPPPEIFWHFFPNGWEFFVQILHAYYMFLSTLDYKFLFNYLQLWRSYAILSATTQFTSYVQNVHHRPKRTLAFSDVFPKQLGIFSPNFTRLLYVPTYVRLQIFIQLPPTLTSYAILSATT